MKSILEKARPILALSRQRADEGHCSMLRQVAEMSWLMATRRNGPGYYHAARLWERGVAWAAKAAHPSEKQYLAALDRLNPLAYRKIFENKLTEKAFLQMAGIPTAPFLGHLHAQHGFGIDGGRLGTPEDLARLVASNPHPRICFKEPEGWGGRNFRAVAVHKRNGEVYFRALPDGQEEALRTYFDRELRVAEGVNWLVEVHLDQDDGYARFNPTSFNTVRMLVIRDADGTVRLVGAYIRMGNGPVMVDHVTYGGFAAPVDVQTGRLGPGWPKSIFEPAVTVHPFSKVHIEGEVLPHWEQLCAASLEAVRRLTFLRYAGLDVGMTPDGPVVFEVNSRPDRLGLARMGTRFTRSPLDIP
ncbi:MAG: hypothetical protein KIT81_10705 [Alphaproteobacteria bacterium]|nr:hypothetical protein [Alphaproteobacteria bacterium]